LILAEKKRVGATLYDRDKFLHKMLNFRKTMLFFLGAKSQITIKYLSHMRTRKIIYNNWIYLFFSRTQHTRATWIYFYTYMCTIRL